MWRMGGAGLFHPFGMKVTRTLPKNVHTLSVKGEKGRDWLREMDGGQKIPLERRVVRRQDQAGGGTQSQWGRMLGWGRAAGLQGGMPAPRAGPLCQPPPAAASPGTPWVPSGSWQVLGRPVR